MAATHNESRILVQNVMQRIPIKAVTSDTVQSALETMIANHVSALPVVDEEDRLIGIVSLNDLMALLQNQGAAALESVMTQAPVTVQADDSLIESAQLMVQHQVHHLPVVGQDKRLVGVISSVDFMRLAAEGILKA